MTRNEECFTEFEGFSLICSSFLFHLYNASLPELYRQNASAAWIALVIGGILSFGLFYLCFLLLRMNDGKDLLEINREIFGPILSKIFVILLLFFFLLYCANNLYEAIDLLVLNTYSHTRSIFLALAFLAVAWVISIYPLKGLGRTASISIFIFLLGIAFILAMAGNQYDATYLSPILGNGVQPLSHSGLMQLSNFHGLLLMLLFAKSFGSVHSFHKSGLWAMCIANLVFIVSTVCYSMSAPYQVLLHNRLGLLNLARSIYINRFFQRFESVFIIFSSMGKLLVISLGMLAVKRLLADLFAIEPRRQKATVLPLALIVLAITQMMFNVPQTGVAVSGFLRSNSVYFILAMLILFLLAGFVRKRVKGKRSVIRGVSMLLLCCICGGLFSGCGNLVSEPDEEMFPIVLGYDKSDSETLRVTMKIMPEDKNSSGGSGGGTFPNQEGSAEGGIPDNVFTVDAPCNVPAADLIGTLIPKHLSLLHVKMLVISEELAREDVDMLITSITRYNEIKPTIAVVICEGTAEEYIAANTSELIPFLPLETEMILKSSKGSSSYLVRTMGDIYNTYSGNYGDALVMYGGLTKAAKEKREEEKREKEALSVAETAESGGAESGYSYPEDDDWEIGGNPDASAGDAQAVPEQLLDDPSIGYLDGYLPGEVPIKTSVESQIAGMAVLRGPKMVGTLNTHQTKIFMLADGSYNGSVLAVRDPYKPDYYVMFFCHTRQKNRVHTSIDSEGVAYIDIEAFVQVVPGIAQNTGADYQDPAEEEMLRQYTERYLEEEVDKLVQKLQAEYDADALRLGRYVAGNFSTVQEWERYNWRERYKDAVINVSINLKF